MRKIATSVLFATSLALASPVVGQNDFSDIVSGVAKSLLAQEMEQNAYREAQRLNTADAYRSYLRRFPNGANRSRAETSLIRLGAAANPQSPAPTTGNTTGASASSASVEASLGLTRGQRTTLQKQLTLLGYPSGVADGLWGSNTRSAIRRWQTANQMPATGYVTARQVRLIEQQAGQAPQATPEQTTLSDDALEERLLGLTSSERREVQRMLTQLGYNTNGIDGNFGRNSRNALASWQRDEALRVSGYITADQMRELRRQTGN